MGLPHLDSCCCGCTTKTGTRIIVWFCLIFDLANICITGITSVREQGQIPSPPDQTTDIATIWTIIESIIGIVICTTALCGVEKGLHSYLVPFLIWFLIDSIITLFLPPPYLPMYRDVPSILMGFVLGIYVWLVIYSHYRDLKKPQAAPSTV